MKSKTYQPDIDITRELKKGVSHHQSGNLEEAERHYYRILAADSHHADALHLIGLVAHQRKDHQRAVEFIRKAIDNNRGCSFYYNNLGAALKEAGNLNDAVISYQQAIQLQPNYPEAAYNLGSIYMIMGNAAEAVQWYEKAIRIKPDYVDALSNLSAAYNKLNRYDNAIWCCEKVLSLNPDNAVALNNLGNAMMAKRAPEQAIIYFQRSIAADPNNPEARGNLGNAYYDLGDQMKALDSYRQALALNPAYAEAFNNMGIVLREMGRLEEAVRCYRQSMQLKPKDAEAYHNLGNILKDQGQLDQAITMYRRAIEYNAASIDSHVNLGIALEEKGDYGEAIHCYLNALQIDSDNAKAHSHLAHQLQNLCAWQQIEPINEKLDGFTAQALKEGRKPDEMPFLNLARHADPCLNFKVAEAWSKSISRQFSYFPKFYPKHNTTRCVEERKDLPVTIGYLSNNFKNHPTAHLVQGMFQLHDRKRFTVHCYSYGKDDSSAYREKIKSTCDRFVDISTHSHIAAAQQIYDEKVDILVDLVGYMKANRLSIPAMRPSPIQVRWLGSAGTTGADFFDYLITDKIVSPAEHASFYSEALVYMPDCYQINDNTQPAAEYGITREAVGLPENGIVFCSLSSRYKYDPILFRTWMRILKQVKGSFLWLLGGNADAEHNLRKFAQSSGVEENRLIFAQKIPRDEHLQRLQLADIALDTRVVNGAITTSEALWAGVPLITLQGTHFASRMSSSILTAARIPDLITHDLEQYESLAIRLALQTDALNKIRRQLQTNRLILPLFDTSRFVRNLEKAFLKMIDFYHSGKIPRQICVDDLSD